MWEVMDWLRWSLEACAAGLYPTARHDGAPWQSGLDDSRSGKAGAPLGGRFAAMFLKGDWMEFVSSLGLPMWSTQAAGSPCPWCFTDGSGMYVFNDVRFPSRLKIHEDYEAACRNCETTVRVGSVEQHLELKGALFF